MAECCSGGYTAHPDAASGTASYPKAGNKSEAKPDNMPGSVSTSPSDWKASSIRGQHGAEQPVPVSGNRINKK